MTNPDVWHLSEKEVVSRASKLRLYLERPGVLEAAVNKATPEEIAEWRTDFLKSIDALRAAVRYIENLHPDLT